MSQVPLPAFGNLCLSFSVAASLSSHQIEIVQFAWDVMIVRFRGAGCGLCCSTVRLQSHAWARVGFPFFSICECEAASW
jgi:hypothetical protein